MRGALPRLAMMKYFLYFILVLLVSFSLGYAHDHIGSYISLPDAKKGFGRCYSEKSTPVVEKLTWKMEINNNEIKVDMNDGDVLIIPYQAEGEYLIGQKSKQDAGEFVFYVEDRNTIHGLNTVFYRDK